MERSRARIAGPAVAAGAVSIGLVLIGACGVGRHDTYVPPPPLKAGQYIEPVAREGSTGQTAPRVVIPPSPTWKVAPYEQRRATPFAGFSSSTTAAEPPEAAGAASAENLRPPAAIEPRDPTPDEPTTPQR
ncbi:hypothetical protein AB0C34_00280 [Nocardia sp. NPDC049220]|uniref:hypothetical protein n=1 Tax=Nocardia sp. NPDC049220 TaxID=3155273 RepID=UPI0033E16AC7